MDAGLAFRCADAILAVKIRLKRLRNAHGSVFVLKVLQYGEHRSSHREAAPVQCVNEAGFGFGLRPIPDFGAPSLKIDAVAAGAYFPYASCAGSQTSMSYVFVEAKPMSPVQSVTTR